MEQQLTPPAGTCDYLTKVCDGIAYGTIRLDQLPSPVFELFCLGEHAGRERVYYWEHLAGVYYEWAANPSKHTKLARRYVDAFEWRIRNGGL